MKLVIINLRILIGLLAMVSLHKIHAKPIDLNTSKEVAYNFIKEKNRNTPLNSIPQLDLVYTYSLEAINGLGKKENGFYVFNINEPKGYIMVSANDLMYPILAYSLESAFNPANIPESVKLILDGFGAQIALMVNGKLESNSDIRQAWDDLMEGESRQKLYKKGEVKPLINTHWGQGKYYNDSCPYNKVEARREYPGNMPLAMAQVLKYWNYPLKGIGSNSYKHYDYGTLSANFGETNYNWSFMLDSLTSTNSEVARLIYHCGIASNNQFRYYQDTQATLSVAKALINHFGYTNNLQRLKKSSFTYANWLSLLRNELDNDRPIIYRAYGNTTTVENAFFICDGYENNTYFHFNYGLDGYYDGYFLITALYYGSGTLNERHEIVKGIEPIRQIELSTKVPFEQNQIYRGKKYSIQLNFVNQSQDTFKGVYRVALFDKTGKLVEQIDTVHDTIGLPYKQSYASPYLTFTKDTIKANLGDYFLKIEFRSDKVNKWQLVYSRDLKAMRNVNIIDSLDRYEMNDSFHLAYPLKMAFNKDTAIILTTGASLNSKIDYDFYKLILPLGYHYQLNFELKDLKNDKDTQGYTTNAIFDYIYTNGSWSKFYEDTIPNPIIRYGGDTLTFFVLSDTNKIIGNYLLHIDVIRYATSAKEIVGFKVNSLINFPVIDTSKATVSGVLPKGSNLKNLVPEITLSRGAIIEPASSVPRDFTKPVNYTVTAIDKSSKIWTITLKEEVVNVSKEITLSGIQLIPNPASDKIQFQYHSKEFTPISADLYTINGNLVKSYVVSDPNLYDEIKIDDLDPGVYHWLIRTNRGFSRHKMVIVR